MAKTPLFECEDEDGNNYILNINWDQGREDIEKKLEEKRKDFENQAAAAKAIENGMKIRKKIEKKKGK